VPGWACSSAHFNPGTFQPLEMLVTVTEWAAAGGELAAYGVNLRSVASNGACTSSEIT
jgi:hypothetical protein